MADASRETPRKVPTALMNGGSVTAMGGAYDAAARNDRNLAMWSPPLGNANNEVMDGKHLSDARVADLARNDTHARAGVEIHQNSVVGSRYILNANPNIKVLNLSEAWRAEFADEVEAKFGLWANSHECYPDAAGTKNFTEIIRMAISSYLISGEVLMSVEWMPRVRRPYYTTFQMIAPDRLVTPTVKKNVPLSRVFGGVEVDKHGKPQGFYIQEEDEYALYKLRSAQYIYRRAANRFGRPEMIYIADQLRPGQVRGVSQMVAAIREFRMARQFRDVSLQNAVLNASFAASVESELPTAQIMEALSGSPGSTLGEGVTDYAEKYLSAVADYNSGADNLKVDGVRIPHLVPGTKLNMLPLGKNALVGSDFEQSFLRILSANLGVSYEELTRDYTNTNYSSARAAMVETRKYMDARKAAVADRVAETMYRLWFEEAYNRGDLETVKSGPGMYEGMNLSAYTQCSWLGGSMRQIDELKETQAAIERINAGLTTYEIEAARLGLQYENVFRQRQREEKLMKELGLKPEEETQEGGQDQGKPKEKKEKPDE